MAVRLATLDRARHLDELAKQQQLFGDGGFTGIRVRNNRQYPATLYVLAEGICAHGVVLLKPPEPLASGNAAGP
jgi:hypothetical protein